MKPFYITTAIDYANGSPHLGHAYEKVLADVVARTRRLRGEPVHFLTGLDEHGQKVQQSAQARGIEPQAICDAVAVEFQALLKTLEHFERRLHPHHRAAPQERRARHPAKAFRPGDDLPRRIPRAFTARGRSSFSSRRTR